MNWNQSSSPVLAQSKSAIRLQQWLRLEFGYKQIKQGYCPFLIAATRYLSGLFQDLYRIRSPHFQNLSSSSREQVFVKLTESLNCFMLTFQQFSEIKNAEGSCLTLKLMPILYPPLGLTSRSTTLSLEGLPPFLGFFPKWRVITGMVVVEELVLGLFIIIISLVTFVFFSTFFIFHYLSKITCSL